MLTSIRVRNLAIAETVDVTFGKGLNVITGETGAGKSILAGALALVLGERADKGMIRSGADTCTVEACVELSAPIPALDALLEELCLPPCDSGLLIVRRTLSTNSASRTFVNDAPITLQSLQQIGDLLVDQHGPHDHQALLAEPEQIRLLDSYGQTTNEREAYEAAHQRVLDLQQERDALSGADGNVQQELDLLRYQAGEIAEAQLSTEDEHELLEEHTRVANASQIVELAATISDALTGDSTSAYDALVKARRAASTLAPIAGEASEWESQLESLLIQAQDISDSAARLADDTDCSPERLQWLDDRLGLIQRLKRKYGGSIEQVLKHLSTIEKRLGDLENREERLAQLDADLADACRTRNERGAALSAKRTKAAKKLAKAITTELHGLGFANSAFEVQLSAANTPRTSGLDSISFAFAPNIGEPMRTLKAVASSGEISRVMLAVKAVLAEHDNIPVLVFDELDANVGGEIGNAVGARMARVAASHQVICITHLPQVAVHGSTHLVATKHVEKGRTRSAISCVTGDARTDEIARMLGGSDLTSVATRHAREMLQAAGQ